MFYCLDFAFTTTKKNDNWQLGSQFEQFISTISNRLYWSNKLITTQLDTASVWWHRGQEERRKLPHFRQTISFLYVGDIINEHNPPDVIVAIWKLEHVWERSSSLVYLNNAQSCEFQFKWQAFVIILSMVRWKGLSTFVQNISSKQFASMAEA